MRTLADGQGDGNDPLHVHKMFGGKLHSGNLGQGSGIISNGNQKSIVISMSHGCKSTSSRENTIYMLTVLFLHTVTNSIGCIPRN